MQNINQDEAKWQASQAIDNAFNEPEEYTSQWSEEEWAIWEEDWDDLDDDNVIIQ